MSVTLRLLALFCMAFLLISAAPKGRPVFEIRKVLDKPSRYYPVEFMARVLSNGKGFYHPLVYILECHRLRIPVLSPSVNSPGPQSSVEG